MASSAQVRSGRVVNGRLAGEDVVVYRTRSGRLRVVRPFCPHLGAHLGHGGRVRGENLVCPLHDAEFGPEGECVHARYDTPGTNARLDLLECREVAGLVFVWWHARGEPPSWEVEAPPADGFGTPYCTARTLVAHPQDFLENVIDTGYCAPVRPLAVQVVEEPRFTGPRMQATYRLGRTTGGRNVFVDPAQTMRLAAQGLGVFRTESTVRPLGLDLRAWFCVTPVDPVRVEMRLALSLRFPRLRPRGVGRLLAAWLRRPLAWASTLDLHRDLPVWANDTCLERPRLAADDGPCAQYRRWTRQFYSDWPTGEGPEPADAEGERRWWDEG